MAAAADGDRQEVSGTQRKLQRQSEAISAETVQACKERATGAVAEVSRLGSELLVLNGNQSYCIHSCTNIHCSFPPQRVTSYSSHPIPHSKPLTIYLADGAISA